MKAVNLVPVEARRGAGAPSRSNGVVYGLLGLLGVFAVVALVSGLSVRNVNERKKELVQLRSETAGADAQAAALAPYSKVVEIARERESTVLSVAALRFGWGAALREIARVVPTDVDLITITGTRGGAGDDNAEQAPAGAATPQFILGGCARTQADVAVFVARLRAIDGVQRVRLETSSKAEESAAGAEGGIDCRRTPTDAQFTSVVFFADSGGSAAGSTVPADETQAAPAAPPTGQDGAS